MKNKFSVAIKNEIDNNLFNREDFRNFLDSLRQDENLIDVDSQLISIKLLTMKASYSDFCFDLVKMLHEEFITNEESVYIAEVTRLKIDSFYEDSDKLKELISSVVKLIDSKNLENSIKKLKSQCLNKYSLYVLERASFEVNWILD